MLMADMSLEGGAVLTGRQTDPCTIRSRTVGACYSSWWSYYPGFTAFGEPNQVLNGKCFDEG